MDKRILILGSIIAVIILIFASFSSVVGFQSNTVSSMRASPLYNIRTKKAIDESNPTLTCGYVGKGKEFTIPIPTRGWKFALLQNALERITKMDRYEFNDFIAEVLHYAENEPEIEYLNNNYLKDVIYQAKVNPDLIRKNPIFLQGFNPLYTLSPLSQAECCTCDNEPDCPTYTQLFGGGYWNLQCYIAVLLLSNTVKDSVSSKRRFTLADIEVS